MAHPAHITARLAALPPDAPPTFSLEFFPPKTLQGQANLHPRIRRMDKDLDPGWIHISWGAGGSTHSTSLDLATRVQNGDIPAGEAPSSSSSRDVCLHLTCTNVDKQSLDATLQQAKQANIRNLLALRGDPPRGDEYWKATDSSFQHGIDLVRYIRAQHGDFFCIGVAGYPEGHPDVHRDVDRDMEHLLEKQKAGADFVVTQLFYDAEVFLGWHAKCRRAGLTIPIIPGIMPIHNYQSFRRLTKLCQVHVPETVLAELEPFRSDDAAVKEYGVKLSISTIRTIHQRAPDVRAFHLCTLNLEHSVRRVVEGLPWSASGAQREAASTAPNVPRNQVLSDASGANTPRELKTSSNEASARAISRLTSTPAAATHLAPQPGRGTSTPDAERAWDEFPNGRWGDARSPAYGEMDGYGPSIRLTTPQALNLWGTPSSPADVTRLFTSYLEGKLDSIPWCDEPLAAESDALVPWLLRLNRGVSPNEGDRNSASSPTTTSDAHAGWWSISSQPAVDGCDSSDASYGFGPPGGYVYQKAFVEMFVEEDVLKGIERRAKELERRSVVGASGAGGGKGGVVSWLAGNAQGTFRTNMRAGDVNAVTWGVFPGKEIVQPTIIEEESFMAWREEAFTLWTEWATLYPKDHPSRKLLLGLRDTRWLVTVVHHDYRDPEALWRFLVEED